MKGVQNNPRSWGLTNVIVINHWNKSWDDPPSRRLGRICADDCWCFRNQRLNPHGLNHGFSLNGWLNFFTWNPNWLLVWRDFCSYQLPPKKHGCFGAIKGPAQNTTKWFPRWWFQIFFISLKWGRFPFWLIFFNWVETSFKSTKLRLF